MYFQNQLDKEYRIQLAKEGHLPSWYWEHKRMNIIDFSKDVYSIFEKNMKKCLDDKSIHSLQDLSDFMINLYEVFSETINDIFKLKDIKRK